MGSRKPKQIKDKEIFKPKSFTARNENQKRAILSIVENQITFLVGGAGVGKTVIAVYSAVQALRKGNVDRIIITRPVLEAGNERLGYLPGTFEEKIHPYLIPIYDELFQFASREEVLVWRTEGKLEIVPLALMRGRNFHNCFVIADELQNSRDEQIVMLLTRLGNNSKMVLTGDVNQSDLPQNLRGGLERIYKSLDGLEEIGVVAFSDNDIVRNPLITKILGRLVR